MTARFVRWPSGGDSVVPKHPYRDAAVFHAALAGAIVLLAWATAGSLGRAVLVAAGYFAVATAWSWWRFHERRRTKAAQTRR